MDKIDRFGDLAVFVRVAALGSFSQAAKELDISTSHASRAVQRVEARVGARLMNRTTRRVVLTEAGRALQGRAGALLDELVEAETAVADQGGEPHGTLRVTMPVQFGIRYVAPIAAAFAERHPNVGFELMLDDRRVDLIAEGFDLAVRIGLLADSSLIARRLGHSRSLIVASDAYLAKHGTPSEPRELVDHQGLQYTHVGPTWKFGEPGNEINVRVPGRFAGNSGEALMTAAIAGLGIARLPDAIAADSVRAGKLRRILVPWESNFPISAVYPPGRHLSPKLRRFVDFLAEGLAPAPWLACGEPKGGESTA
jgi:DNA-binding transcriptional LysR family regulator